MLHPKLRLLTLLAAAGMLLLAGCSGDDSPTNPGNSGNIITLAPEEAEDFTTSALTMVNGLVDDIPEFATGDFAQYNMAKSHELAGSAAGKAQSDSVQWDAAQQAYTFAYAGPVFVLEAPNYWNMNLEIWLQYRDAAGSPLQIPVGAVEMEVDYVTGMDMHVEDESSSATMSYDMTTNVTVAYLGQESYGLTGAGSTRIQVAQSAGQSEESGSFDMDWTLDLVTTATGCPSGSAEVTAQGYTLNAVYDGQGGVDWTLVGPSYSSSGQSYMACGQGMN